ncbi:hypothetical protein K469DRAFT_756579 [Zopfia rhizophila CBS 207.26]|uniref:C2H2-type domain-containing protein n=1 Tax=Zopfia rhizophila CBS 207.26 TaxID=1314779 RepID=A0A6A6D616_9PEZI|nr:hypothetical protein K469DRAFT_756579 [Zopfia rhizophila CBS 207.26]
MGEAYCARCERRFSSQQALQQHYDDSTRHYRCDTCGFDGFTWEKFLQHHRKTGHRVVCQGCDDGEGMTWIAGSQEYLAHLKEQNVCQACEEHFESLSNLHHHKMVHLPRSIECYGCYRKFATLPAMIIHLESGSCPSGIDIVDLNESAAMCFQWKAYLDEDYQDELLNRVDLQSEYSLLQHVYSKACNQSLYEGKMAKLIKWLEKRHSVDEG